LGGQTALNAKWTIDGYADVTWFGSNTDFVGGDRQQAALYPLPIPMRWPNHTDT